MTQKQFYNLPDQERLDLLLKNKDNIAELFSDYDQIKPDDSYYPKYPLEEDLVAARKRTEELEEQLSLYLALHKGACEEVDQSYKRITELEQENAELKKDCFDLAYGQDFLTKQFAFDRKRVELLEEENEKLKSTIVERDIEIERRAHAANHNAHLCEIARAEAKVLEEENEKLKIERHELIRTIDFMG